MYRWVTTVVFEIPVFTSIFFTGSQNVFPQVTGIYLEKLWKNKMNISKIIHKSREKNWFHCANPLFKLSLI